MAAELKVLACTVAEVAAGSNVRDLKTFIWVDLTERSSSSRSHS